MLDRYAVLQLVCVLLTHLGMEPHDQKGQRFIKHTHTHTAPVYSRENVELNTCPIQHKPATLTQGRGKAYGHTLIHTYIQSAR